jgi:LPXTG-motif cell wall-anchored protein
MAETGSGWGLILLLGFALAGLLVVVRLLRVRALPG